jgi:hypothetical protein
MGFVREKPHDDQSKDDDKREGEQTVALRLCATTHLENATVTGDALNNNNPQARAVLDGGGDYFFQLKNENRPADKAAVQKAKATPRSRHPPRTLRPAPDKSLSVQAPGGRVVSQPRSKDVPVNGPGKPERESPNAPLAFEDAGRRVAIRLKRPFDAAC